MNPQEIAALKEAFSESLAPIWQELKGIHSTLGEQGQVLHEHTELLHEHSKLLREQGELLHSIDTRLTNVEGILSGVEILVRKKAG